MTLLSIARTLMIFGVILFITGGLLYLLTRIGFHPTKMPGDIHIQRENFSCVIALGTSIALSILLTLVLNILARFLNR